VKDTNTASAASTHISFNISEATNARFNVIELGDGNALVQLEVIHSSYEGLEMLTFSSQQFNVNLTLEQVKALRLELVRYLMKVQYPNLNADVEPTINDLVKNYEENLANEGV
jgi:hypothetical protein